VGIFWIALAVWLGASVAGLAFAALRGLQLFRHGKRASKRINGEVESIARASGEIEAHLARASESAARLNAALDRLRGSRARLEVQRQALREAGAMIGWALPFLPRR